MIRWVLNCRYNVDCVVANILMTRYDEIRLVFNKMSCKNKLELKVEEENEMAAIELYLKNSDLPLEYSFIPRLVESHDLFISSSN